MNFCSHPVIWIWVSEWNGLVWCAGWRKKKREEKGNGKEKVVGDVGWMANPGYGKRRMLCPKWMPDVGLLNPCPCLRKTSCVMDRRVPSITGSTRFKPTSRSWNDVSAYESRKEKKGVERNLWMCWKKEREKRFWKTEKRVSEKDWEFSDGEVDIGECVDDGIVWKKGNVTYQMVVKLVLKNEIVLNALHWVGRGDVTV